MNKREKLKHNIVKVMAQNQLKTMALAYKDITYSQYLNYFGIRNEEIKKQDEIQSEKNIDDKIKITDDNIFNELDRVAFDDERHDAETHLFRLDQGLVMIAMFGIENNIKGGI